AELAQVLRHVPTISDPRILVDAATRDDAAVYQLTTDRAIVATVDFFTPIVDDPYDYGRVAATNALSDVYAMGGRPLTSLALLCFPDGTLGPEVLREVLRGGQDAMRRARCSIVGGHSVRDPELKFGYAVTGVVDRRRMLTNAGARVGDRLLLTKPLGTGVLATALKHGRLEPALVRRLTTQMATLNRAAAELAVRHRLRGATDVTGFSLLGHASQMAAASGVTFELAPAEDWLLPRVLELADAGEIAGGVRRNRSFYGPRVDVTGLPDPLAIALFDPQTSGGLLLAAPERVTARLTRDLRAARVWVRELGRVVKRSTRDVVCVRP
ncbi:MAG TPA: selenide, water dikinase SelD, partial [Dongiaceae bacterium]|nr:selenide, water dikinase SelD [Dongiaceae bacterium]